MLAWWGATCGVMSIGRVARVRLHRMEWAHGWLKCICAFQGCGQLHMVASTGCCCCAAARSEAPPKHWIRTLRPLGLLLQDGRTTLPWAASKGCLKVVELLLGAGAAVDATDKVTPAYAPPSYLEASRAFSCLRHVTSSA
jgi:hypothetical protein